MAGPYYVDIGSPGAWDTLDGLSSGNCWKGISGLQKAFHTVTAAEICYIKGTGDLSKWYSCAYDANSGSPTVGEAVTWDAGASAGVIYYVGAISPPGTVFVEFISGTAPGDDDVILGTTSGNSVTLSAVAVQSGLNLDGKTGTTVAGWIYHYGVNASWARDGTRAVIDANSSAVHGISTVAATDLVWFENIEVRECGGTSKNGFNIATDSDAHVFVNCCSHNCSGSGWSASTSYYTEIIRCVSYLNTESGIIAGLYGLIAFSCSHDNTVYGFSVPNIGKVFGCLSYDNTSDGFNLWAANHVINSVANMNDGNGITAVNPGKTNESIIGCRITNQSQAGTDAGINYSSNLVITMCNYFKDNGDANADDEINDTLVKNISTDGSTTSSNVYDDTDDDEGYVSQVDGSENLNLNDDALLRRTAITIPII